jgi:YaiO family outer membrane protein
MPIDHIPPDPNIRSMGVRWRGVAAGLVLLITPRLCCAQTSWALDVGTERSLVTSGGMDTTWDTVRVQAGAARPEVGGLYAAVERQRRGRSSDFVTSVTGYRRMGDWTLGGGVSGAPHASFLYRAGVEADLSRRIAGTTVASIGYRHFDFRIVSAQQIQPGLTWYHRRGEVEGRLHLTRKEGLAGASVTGLFSTLFDATPRVRLAMSAAYGDRIFDVAAIPTQNATASMVNARLRIGVTRHDFVEVSAGMAHENPVFDQRTFGLVYRRTF